MFLLPSFLFCPLGFVFLLEDVFWILPVIAKSVPNLWCIIGPTFPIMFFVFNNCGNNRRLKSQSAETSIEKVTSCSKKAVICVEWMFPRMQGPSGAVNVLIVPAVVLGGMPPVGQHSISGHCLALWLWHGVDYLGHSSVVSKRSRGMYLFLLLPSWSVEVLGQLACTVTENSKCKN